MYRFVDWDRVKLSLVAWNWNERFHKGLIIDLLSSTQLSVDIPTSKLFLIVMTIMFR